VNITPYALYLISKSDYRAYRRAYRREWMRRKRLTSRPSPSQTASADAPTPKRSGTSSAPLP
jgi:hypothetical protein